MQMALLVPDDSLLHFWQIKNIICIAQRNIFHLGWVLPSNDMFLSHGASLVKLFKK